MGKKRKIDYSQIEIPKDKDPWEYDYRERRAEILQRHKNSSNPYQITQTEMAKEFDVTPSQISRDMDKIRDYITRNISGKKLAFESTLIIDNAVKGLMSQGKYYKAVQVLETKLNFYLDLGFINKEEDWDEDQALNKLREIAETEDIEDKNNISEEVIKSAIKQ